MEDQEKQTTRYLLRLQDKKHNIECVSLLSKLCVSIVKRPQKEIQLINVL